MTVFILRLMYMDPTIEDCGSTPDFVINMTVFILRPMYSDPNYRGLWFMYSDPNYRGLWFNS